jgi:hypothetical protein
MTARRTTTTGAAAAAIIHTASYPATTAPSRGHCLHSSRRTRSDEIKSLADIGNTHVEDIPTFSCSSIGTAAGGVVVVDARTTVARFLAGRRLAPCSALGSRWFRVPTPDGPGPRQAHPAAKLRVSNHRLYADINP